MDAASSSAHLRRDPAAPAAQAASSAVRPACHGCGRPIKDRWLLNAVDRSWHETCLRCSYCQCVLADVGPTLFARADLLLCRRDYLRLFGTSGYCSYCEQAIAACDMVMRAKENVYHLDCFACFKCQHRFCVGDRYYLLGVRILCEADYEDHLRQLGEQFQQPCNGALQQQPVSMATHTHHHSDGETSTTSSSMAPWYQTSEQLVPAARRLQLGADNHRTLLDDRSSGYGSPSPPCV